MFLANGDELRFSEFFHQERGAGSGNPPIPYGQRKAAFLKKRSKRHLRGICGLFSPENQQTKSTAQS